MVSNGAHSRRRSNVVRESQVGLYEPPEQPAQRARRRMNIDQLEAAFLRVSDGLNWTERRNGRDESLFGILAVTLGKPDYIQTTSEVLEPTALFQKFLDDAARQVCNKMVERDQSRAEPILVKRNLADNEINQHLSNLILRFHSRVLREDSRDLAVALALRHRERRRARPIYTMGNSVHCTLHPS